MENSSSWVKIVSSKAALVDEAIRVDIFMIRDRIVYNSFQVVPMDGYK